MKKMFLTVLLVVSSVSLTASVIQKTVELAAKKSGIVLAGNSKTALGKTLGRAFSKYGDDALRIAENGGLEAIKQGAKYGDDFWRIAKHGSPQAIRSLALHADELMPAARRLGPDFMHLESKVPGLGAKIVAEFGDDNARMLARTASPDDISKLAGYAGKADSPATVKLLLEKYRTGGSKFLNTLNWKHIMSGGLSAAAIISAYKISNGVENGINDAARNHPEKFIEGVTGVLAPVKWGIFILLLCIMYPVLRFFIRTGGRIKLSGKTSGAESDTDDPGKTV